MEVGEALEPIGRGTAMTIGKEAPVEHPVPIHPTPYPTTSNSDELQTLCSPEAIEYLRQRDPLLGEAMGRLDPVELPKLALEPFAVLIRNIAGQQLSDRVVRVIWGRLCALCPSMEAAALRAIDPSQLRSCGLSGRKVQYIQGIAERVAEGALGMEELPNLSDSKAIQALTACSGVGPWTAEMLLLFSYRRPDILSWNDLGIRQGLMRLYGLENLTKEQFQIYRRRYSPCGSTASLYLWAIADEGKGRMKPKGSQRA
ncbi:MAG: hypothetical protein LBD54_02850 [Puniceicoccales bacterium]|nr:hypothetical protein [Puniceicoccales bacterium]